MNSCKARVWQALHASDLKIEARYQHTILLVNLIVQANPDSLLARSWLALGLNDSTHKNSIASIAEAACRSNRDIHGS